MNVTYLVYTMKNILFSALLCLSVLVISCTSEQNNANYTFQIPRSLIKEAKNTPTVPAFTKKIADTGNEPTKVPKKRLPNIFDSLFYTKISDSTQ